MLDELLGDVVNEVALEGDQGCTIDTLFELVSALLKKILHTQLAKPLLFDDKYKAYLWTHIRLIDQLVFKQEDKVVDAAELSYEDLYVTPGSIRVIATEEALDRNLYGNLKTEKKSLNDKHKLILAAIAKSRSQGISQYQLADVVQMDRKNTFYYVKKLDQLGLIIKEEASASGVSTRMLYLKRFHQSYTDDPAGTENEDEEDAPQNVQRFKKSVLDLLDKTEGHALVMQDLIQLLGLTTKRHTRWARVKISEMHDQGELEKFVASDGKNSKQCVRLLSKPTDNLSPQQTTASPVSEGVFGYPFNRDLPTDYVFYQDVVDAKEKGILRQDLIDKYPFIDPAQPQIFFESATIVPKNPDFLKYLIHRTEELKGRTRIFRYFSQKGWHLFKEAMGDMVVEKSVTGPITSTSKVSEVLVEPKSIDEIGLAFKEEVLNRKSKPTKAKKQKVDTKASEKGAQSKQDPSQTVAKEIPTKRSHDDNSTQSSLTVLKKSKKKAAFDNTKARRFAILLDMLEQKHVRELNQDLLKEFGAIEAATEGARSIGRSTMNSLVKQLCEQNKLKMHVCTVEKPYGLKEIKTFLLHSSISGDSPEVKQLIESYKLEKPMMNSHTKWRELKKVQMDSLPAIEKPESPAPSASPAPYHTNPSWAYRAIEYGYIRSKWLRARELHEALFECMKAGNDDGSGAVKMTDFLKTFSMRRLIRIFGVFPFNDERLVQFLDVDENRDIPISKLPTEIKVYVSDATSKIRAKIVNLLCILEALELIEPVSCLRVRGMPSEITLHSSASIRDYSLKERPVRSTLPLRNMEEIRSFWRDLKACCIGARMWVDTVQDADDPLRNILLIRGWGDGTLLTQEQKTLLNSFVDFEAKKIPDIQDFKLQNYLAKATGLSQQRIKIYYDSLTVSFNKYEIKKRAKLARQKRKAMTEASSATIDALMKASVEKRKISTELFKAKQTEPFVESTFVGSRKLRRLRVVTEPYRGQDKPFYKPKKQERNGFSEVEKDVLLHAYCIMKARAESSVFYWSPITQLLPNHKIDKYRRTLYSMNRSDPHLSAKIDSLKQEWLDIYKKGIEKGEIKDPTPWETLDYDLVYFFEYFVTKLKERETVRDQSIVVLPNRLSDLHAEFSIIQNSEKHQHFGPSVSLSQDEFDTLPTTPKFDPSRTQIKLAIVLIKMTLITPEEIYHSKDAFSLLRTFPESVIQQALNTLKEEGLVVQDKSKYGRIPGRLINVSEKFLTIAAGILPYRFFKDARDFYDRLASKVSFPLTNDMLNSGSAAAIMDLLAQRKICLSLQNQDKYIAQKKGLYYPKASAVSLRRAYVYRYLDLAIQRKQTFEINVDKDTKHLKSTPTSIPTYREIQGYLTTLGSPAKQVYDAVNSFGESGASLSEVKAKITAYQLHDKLVETLDALINHEPVLIHLVGFEHLRYVTSEFLSVWLLKQPDSSGYIAPLMWHDTKGSVVQEALKGSAEAVMSHILQNPGISFLHLRNRFRGFFTGYELYHILRHLLGSNQIIARKIQRKAQTKKQFSLFDKRPIVSSSSGTFSCMNDDESTCYWLARNYYLSK